MSQHAPGNGPRVAFVCHSLCTYGGVETRLLDYVRHFKARGARPEVLVLRKLGQVTHDLDELGVPYRLIKVISYDEGRYKIHAGGFLKLFWRLHTAGYRSVIALQPYAHQIMRLAAFPPLGQRVFALECLSLGKRSPKLCRIDRLVQHWTTRILVIAPLMRDELLGIGVDARKIAVLEYGIYIPEPQVTDEVAQLRARLDGCFVFGSYGLLQERKRPLVVLRAFVKIAKKFPHARLLFAGAGDQEEDVRREIAEHGLQDVVFMLGEKRNIHDYYPLLDVFVFASVFEGFGCVWAEAHMHRVAVICSDVRPMNDYLVHEQNSLLFEPDNVDGLAAQMARMVEDEPLRRRLVDEGERFSNEKFDATGQLDKLYDTLLGDAQQEGDDA